MTYLLIPLDDAIVFPTVTATLPIDVGEEERVFLIPRRDGEYGRVGVVAEVIERGVSRRGAPGRDRGRPAPRARRRRPGGRRRRRRACGSRCRRSATGTPTTSTPASWRASTAPWSRRSSSCAATTAASPPSCARSRSRARWPTPPASAPTSPTSGKLRLLETIDVTARLRAGGRAAARAPGRAAGAQQDPRGRRVRRPEAAARLLPAQTDGVDPQGAGRGRGRPDRGVRAQDRRGRDAGGGRRAGREGAAPARAPGRAVARVLDDPQLPRLADRGAVVRSAPRSGSTRSTRARCSTPTTPASTT